MEFEHDRAIHDHEVFLNELMKLAEEEAKQQQQTKQPASPPKSSTSSSTSTATSSTSASSTKFAVILPTGLRSQMLSHIQLLVEKLGGRMVNSYSPQVTHIVTLADAEGLTKRTIKYCQVSLFVFFSFQLINSRLLCGGDVQLFLFNVGSVIRWLDRFV